MRGCPNCGRATARTEDWACQWCGYPLLSKSYKKIPKTYQQIQEEKLYAQKPSAREEAEAFPPASPETLPPIPVPEPVTNTRLLCIWLEAAIIILPLISNPI